MTVKPRPTKTSSISRQVCVSRCRRPTGCGGSPGSVTSTRSAIRRASSSAPSSSPARCAISASSAWRASLAARPTWPRCSGGSSATPRSRFGQLGLAPQEAHPQLLELGRRGGRRDRRLGLRPQAVDPLDHASGTLVDSYSATVAAIAAFSESPAIGMWATASQAPSDRGRQARRARRRPRACPRAGRAARRRRRRPARSAAPGSSLERLHAGDGHGEDRAHRRPHGLGRERVGAAGAERDARRPEGQRAAHHGADVAGVAHAPQRNAQRAGRLRPALLEDARARACPSPAPRRRAAAPPPRRRRRAARTPAPSPRPRQRRAGPRPRRQSADAALALQAADFLELVGCAGW